MNNAAPELAESPSAANAAGGWGFGGQQQAAPDKLPAPEADPPDTSPAEEEPSPQAAAQEPTGAAPEEPVAGNQCPLCEFNAKTIRGLTQHMNARHKAKPAEEPTEPAEPPNVVAPEDDPATALDDDPDVNPPAEEPEEPEAEDPFDKASTAAPEEPEEPEEPDNLPADAKACPACQKPLDEVGFGYQCSGCGNLYNEEMERMK